MSQPAPFREIARRLLVAAAVGVVVAGGSYLAAFSFLRGSFLVHSPAWTTRAELRGLAATIEEYKEKKGHYPATLTDIDGVKEAFKLDADGRPIDYWGHPLQYAATEDGFTLLSFGRDGQPGGEGEDADVYHDRPLALPSFHRFTFELPTRPIRWVCLLTGIGAAVVVGFPSRDGPGGLLARAVGTTLGALLMAVFMSAIHIPSGH